MTPKSPETYRALPYEWVWEICDEEGLRYFTVHLAEIPCVIGGGPTKDAALRAMDDAFDDYLNWRLAEGLPIPAPRRVLPREPFRRVTITMTAIRQRPADSLQFRRSEPTLETGIKGSPPVYEATYPELEQAAA